MKRSIAAIILLLASGCVSITEKTKLADGSETTTRGYTFWSETGLPLADSSKKLNKDGYERNTRLEGLETDPETESVAAMTGMVGSVFGAQQQTIIELIKANNQPESTDMAELTQAIKNLQDELSALKEAAAPEE